MAHAILVIIVNGLLIGGLYGLIAMGFSLQYGVARVLNLAHGEFMMFAAFSSLALYSMFGISPLLSVAIIGAGLFIVGFALHRSVFRSLLRSSPSAAAFEGSSLLATFGLLYIIQNIAKVIWPGLPWQGSYLNYLVSILGVQVTVNRVVAFSFALAIALAFYFFLARSRTGKAIRAAAQDRATAGLMGINVDSMLALCFGLGIGMVGIAGVLYAMYYAASTDMGMNNTFIAMAVVVVGGLGSIPGALIAGLILGVVSQILRQYAPIFAIPTFYFIFLIMVLARPTGILGKR
jgi:branched-chain amino acid transport system permease protein